MSDSPDEFEEGFGDDTVDPAKAEAALARAEAAAKADAEALAAAEAAEAEAAAAKAEADAANAATFEPVETERSGYVRKGDSWELLPDAHPQSLRSIAAASRAAQIEAARLRAGAFKVDEADQVLAANVPEGGTA